MKPGSLSPVGRAPGGVFSWFDLRVGLPAAASPGVWSTLVPIFSLLGEPGVSGLDLVGVPMVGNSFIALSKT